MKTDHYQCGEDDPFFVWRMLGIAGLNTCDFGCGTEVSHIYGGQLSDSDLQVPKFLKKSPSDDGF